MVMHKGKPFKAKPFLLMAGLEMPIKMLATESDTTWKLYVER
jgi:hypothetical protein